MMKTKIVVNKPYKAALGDFVKSIPTRNEQLGQVIYAGRNTIYHINVDGIDLSIKSFKVPMLINRIAYTFFRKSKARRSYEHAVALQQMAFDTRSAGAQLLRVPDADRCTKHTPMGNTPRLRPHN